MKNRLFVPLAALLAAFALHVPMQMQAQTPSRPLLPAPFGDGEELLYTVSYRAALIPTINMMRISIRTSEEGTGAARQFHIVGNGRTTGAAKGIFELNDTYNSWLDARTLLPSRATSDLREKNYQFRASYTYDWGAMTVRNVRRNAKWDADRSDSFALPSTASADALSLLYRMRAIDPAKLSPGEVIPLELVLDRDAKPIVLRFIGREEVKVRRLGRFRALRFTCTMATSDGSTYEEGMTLTAWISDDENKSPLMIESPIRVGRVTVSLAEGFKALHPLDSLIKN
jgi:hypothetical protein